jgi:hypothetical protein
MEKKNRKCIVKHNGYEYYHNGTGYGNGFSNAKIYNSEKELPENIKNNPKNEIIFLDTERGLELLVAEIEKLRKLLVKR